MLLLGESVALAFTKGRLRIHVQPDSKSSLQHRAFRHVPDRFHITSQHRAGYVSVLELYFAFADGKFLFADDELQRPFRNADLDLIPFLDIRNQAAGSSFRSDMTDARSPGGAGETPIGDNRTRLPQANSHERGRR